MIKKNIFSCLLLPFSWIYGTIIYFRNKLFDLGILRAEEFNIPVISVGNITVGGTGKTPHIEYLVNLLKDDFRLAVLSRGYKRKTRGFVLADDFSDAEMIGDEPCQVKKKFPGIVVAVDADRRRGIRKIMESGKEIDLVLLDDAFQHRHVKPGLSILLIDYNRMINEDYLLPAGRLREPASAKKRADIIIISKSPGNIKPVERQKIFSNLKMNPRQQLYFTTVIQNHILPVFKDSDNRDIPAMDSKTSILLVSGIADPHELFTFARTLSPEIKHLQFPDHHSYTESDIQMIRNHFEKLDSNEKILVTTEKDAVRLQKFSDLPVNLKNCMFYIPITIKFINDDGEEFNNHIINYVKSNKRNSILHQGKDEVPA